MKPSSFLALSALALTLASSSGCNYFQSRAVMSATCPDLGRGRDALNLYFTQDPRSNGKIRTFVQAANDAMGVASTIEMEVATACQRIGFDLGVPQQAMVPRPEQGGRASGACGPVAARLDWILRSGVQVSVQVTPPMCQANAQASARCAGACGGAMGDAECQASCRAHADIHGSCTQPMINVNSSDARLAQTLQANLPMLLHAELTLARRLAGDVQTLGQVGANLPQLVGNAGVHALGCIAGAADASVAASAQINGSLRASASISGRIGATSGF